MPEKYFIGNDEDEPDLFFKDDEERGFRAEASEFDYNLRKKRLDQIDSYDSYGSESDYESGEEEQSEFSDIGNKNGVKVKNKQDPKSPTSIDIDDGNYASSYTDNSSEKCAKKKK